MGRRGIRIVVLRLALVRRRGVLVWWRRERLRLTLIRRRRVRLRVVLALVVLTLAGRRRVGEGASCRRRRVLVLRRGAGRLV